MRLSKLAPLLIIIVLAIILLFLRRNDNGQDKAGEAKLTSKPKTSRGLNRNSQFITYSKHAKCRMQCRDITEREIKKVLQNGKINYRKSDLQQEECKKRYAVEDVANNQNIRIVVAQCEEELTVITCIDLDKEWACNCD